MSSTMIVDPFSTSPQTTNLIVALPMEQILKSARKGDHRAFGRLIEHYVAAAQRVARQILRTEEDAADAVQEALLKAHRALHRFNDGNFRAWLLRIVANTCYDHLRRTKRHSTTSLDELIENQDRGRGGFEPVAEDNPEEQIMQQETMRLILTAINELAVWQQAVVILIDVQGHNYAEAAEILKLPIGTVKSRLNRARIILRDLLAEQQLILTAP